MKKILLSLCVLLIAGASYSQQIKKVKINDVVHMMDTATCPIVVNFWASWCKPCIHEIPWFEKNIDALKDKGVKLLLVSLDLPQDYPKYLTAFTRKEGYRSEIVWLDESNADLFCKKIDPSWDGNIPVTMMINNKKKYRQFFGQQLPEQRLKLELQKLLD
jgi:thiol-disulfide isomerase/thioredoxin